MSSTAPLAAEAAVSRCLSARRPGLVDAGSRLDERPLLRRRLECAQVAGRRQAPCLITRYRRIGSRNVLDTAPNHFGDRHLTLAGHPHHFLVQRLTALNTKPRSRLSHGDHIMPQSPQFLDDRHWKVLVGVDTRHSGVLVLANLFIDYLSMGTDIRHAFVKSSARSVG